MDFSVLLRPGWKSWVNSWAVKLETPEFLTGLCHQQAVYSERGALAAPLSSVCGRICVPGLPMRTSESRCVWCPGYQRVACVSWLLLEFGEETHVHLSWLPFLPGVSWLFYPSRRSGCRSWRRCAAGQGWSSSALLSCQTSSSSSYSWGEFISSGRPGGGEVRSSAGFSRDHFFKDTKQPVLWCHFAKLFNCVKIPINTF